MLLFILIIGFTSPNAILRPAVVPLIVACASKVTTISPTLLSGPWSAWCCGAIACNLVNYIELRSDRQMEFRDPESYCFSWASSPSRQVQGTPRICNHYANPRRNVQRKTQIRFFVLLSSRNVGAPYMVKETPEFSTKDPNYVPSRREFLFRGAALIMLAILALDLASLAAQPLEYNKVAFSVGVVQIFRGSSENLKIQKLVIRSATVLGYWLVHYLLVNGIFSLLSFTHVALGIENVRAYRPNFGPICE